MSHSDPGDVALTPIATCNAGEGDGSVISCESRLHSFCGKPRKIWTGSNGVWTNSIAPWSKACRSVVQAAASPSGNRVSGWTSPNNAWTAATYPGSVPYCRSMVMAPNFAPRRVPARPCFGSSYDPCRIPAKGPASDRQFSATSSILVIVRFPGSKKPCQWRAEAHDMASCLTNVLASAKRTSRFRQGVLVHTRLLFYGQTAGGDVSPRPGSVLRWSILGIAGRVL